jgi:uncharacterized protein with HEPN domain
MRSERERLLDIMEANERIEKYAARGKAAFLENELIQNWMVNHITLIGEAYRALPDEFQTSHANVLWIDIIAMRNLLVPIIFKLMQKQSGPWLNAIYLN